MRIIAGEWGGRRIRSPRGRGTRPTADRVREAWMSMMGEAVADARVLDLFAGSGALGLECLSRGAREAVFVERSARALRVLRKNVGELGAGERARVVAGDAHGYVAGLEAGSFDVALADPPYDVDDAARMVRAFLEVPFAGELWIEHRASEELPGGHDLRTRRYGDTAITRIEEPA